jgi:hypothetical protein
MRMTCPCGEREINIPDDKLPAVPKFGLKCPYCQKKLIAERVGDTLRSTFAEPQPAPAPSASAEPRLPAVEPDIFPPGASSAFLELDNAAWRKAAEDFLKEQGFYISEAEETLVGVAKLRLNNYRVVLLEDRPDTAPLLQEISSWPGHKRRSVNVLMIGSGAASMQPAIAFEKSVNAYLNEADVSRAGLLLAETLDAYELYYQPFAMQAEKV